jgi:YbbR domain-containing protein
VGGLTLLPETVKVTVPVEQRFGYKDVSVRAVVVGQVAPGYRVSNISVDPPTITIVGNPNLLSDISGFIETAQIDLSQATESIVRTVPLNLPDGISVVFPDRENQQGPGGVQVTVDIAAIEDGIILQRPITQQGIDPAYWWEASPNRADVFLSGPIPQLQNLKASDVEVIVDLFGLELGVHKLKPTVFVPDNFRVDAILPDTIEVTIGSNLTPTPTVVPSPTSSILRSRTPLPDRSGGTPQAQTR